MPVFTRHPCRIAWVVVPAVFLASLSARGADLVETIEDVYAAHGAEHVHPDVTTDCGPAVEEVGFILPMLSVADEVTLLNANVARWLSSEGRRGLHPAHYAERVGPLTDRLEDVSFPEAGVATRDYLVDSIRLQSGFVREWANAVERKKSFESQRTDENAYHEGLHRSDRLLLKAYAEMQAFLPNRCDETTDAIRIHFHAMAFP